MTTTASRKTPPRAKLGFSAQAAAPQAAAVTEQDNVQASRIGRVSSPFWTTVAGRKQLKEQALALDMTQQDCIREALNDWFEKQGKPRIA